VAHMMEGERLSVQDRDEIRRLLDADKVRGDEGPKSRKKKEGRP
jgi:hypothetical protein